jgi:hypothetical protein
VSSTVVIPSYVSNMKIEGGSLVANPLSSFWNSTAGSATQSRATAGATAASAPRPMKRAARNDIEACDATSFPHNVTGKWCQQLSPGSGTTPEDCQKACCNEPSCDVWQFCPTTHGCFAEIPQKISCWLGTQNSCTVDPVPSGVRSGMCVVWRGVAWCGVAWRGVVVCCDVVACVSAWLFMRGQWYAVWHAW